jgi:formate dehydrogenase subunit gamma
MRRALALLSMMILAFGLLAAPPATAPAFAQNPQTQPGANPSGSTPTADAVNEEFLFKQGSTIDGRVSIPDQNSAKLIQPQGRDYRAFREGSLLWISAIAILGMALALALFYFWRGRIRSARSGEKILRFNAVERFTHWMTAVSFIVLALSGLNYIFGKRLIMPLIGPDAFGALSQLAKYAHVYLAWPFMLGVAIMLVVWIKDNIPNRVDLAWLKAGGGMVGDGHPSAYRFNAGQKGIFWMVVGFGAAMAVTGLIMLFPFTMTDINGMQLTQVVHSVIGVLFIAGILAHIYIGTLGMEGAYDAMGNGEVDLAWAREHHDLWVAQQQAKTAGGPQIRPHSVPAE